MIKYLGAEIFGVWATMLTLVNWIMLFDLGLGNGLRNKIAESLALDDEKACAQYISTSYVVVSVVSVVVFLLLFVSALCINWNLVFNTSVLPGAVLFKSVILLAFFVLLNFVLSLVLQVFNGYQESSFVSFGQFLSNAFALIFVAILYGFSSSSLVNVVLVYGAGLVASNLFLSFYMFGRRSEIRPRFSNFDMPKVGGLFSLGARFFIIQIAVLVMLMSDKMIITQLFGPNEVTNYEVVFKLYSILAIFHGLILTPLWSAFSDAYANNDFQWIKIAIKKQLMIFLFFVLCAVLLAFLGPSLAELWVGSAVVLDWRLFFFFSAYMVVSVWSNIFACFVNAINKVNIQVVAAVFAALINIPLSIYFVRFLGFGVEGVVLATTVSLSIYALIGPVQVIYILNKEG